MSLTKMSVRSPRAVALLIALEAAASGQMRTRESDADRFRAAHAMRLAKLGDDVRALVLRDLAALPREA